VGTLRREPKRLTALRLAETPKVRTPAACKVSGSVSRASSSVSSRPCTLMQVGYWPVNTDATEGLVQLEAAIALRQTIDSWASASTRSASSRVEPEAPTWSARKVSITIKTTPRTGCAGSSSPVPQAPNKAPVLAMRTSLATIKKSKKELQSPTVFSNPITPKEVP
jgi:hypothetical protein